MNIKLIGDRVLIKVDEKEKETKSGIVLMPNSQEIPNTGTILEVGPGAPNYTMVTKKGDHVLFPKTAGSEITHEGETYLLMRESEIYAVI